MRFGRRKRREDEEVELNLVPMMDLLVSLVPFMLLSAAFVKFGAIPTETPVASSKQQEQKLDKPEVIDLVFQVTENEVAVTGFKSGGFERKIPEIEAKFTTDKSEEFKNYLKALEVKFPKVGASLFKAASDIRYERATNVLSTLREHPFLGNVVLAAEVVE